jgi:hypothetical protein
MSVAEQIKAYLASLPEAKQEEMDALHKRILKLLPKCKQWFLDGKDENGKVVSNPNIGYGSYTMTYKDGSTREFYQIGLSANTTGISVYIMGLEDKKYLADTYSETLGKASITGYCIKFKKLADIDLAVLDDAIRHGVTFTSK